jgi:two-component system, OmpR family, phosphate regulon sensor histidine kinase PhoR
MPRELRNAWLTTAGRIGLVLAGALVVGTLTGYPWQALTVAALGTLAWQSWMLSRLVRHVAMRQRPRPRPGRGVWHELDRLLRRNRHELHARKRHLLALLRAYRAAAAALPDAVVVVDRNSQRIHWFNDAATPLLGLQAPRDFQAALGERLQPMPIAHWLASGRHAEPLSDVRSPVSPEIQLNLRLIPYSDALWLLIARDVTQRMRLEQMRSDFVANVSHELRTPLTVVHGYLEMLDPADHPEWEPVLTEMRRQSQRMTQLVEDLLTLSRLEASDALTEESVPMAGMLASLRREAEALSQQRHTITVEDDAHVDLWGSQKELHSAFSNLVSNAVRYTPTGGSIAIRYARAADGGALVSVQDSGYGIPAAHLPRLTERFYRVSASRSRESGGTGLGLAIVKHILGLHQARLEIESEVGRGTRFTCHFGAERVRLRPSQEVAAT